MKKYLFQGVCTALVTPFLNNEINYEMLDKLIAFQRTSGVNAIALAGTTGEAPTLSDKEKISLFKLGKECAGDACTVIAGTGSNSTGHCVELSIAAQEAGVDALLVVSPYYNKANIDGLIKHYQMIAEAVRLPVILYNVPSRTGLDIPVSVYKHLADIQNIVGVKEASNDITKITDTLAACPPKFQVWTGNDAHTVAAMSVGAKGVISVASNVCPKEIVLMADAVLHSDIKAAAALQRQLNKLNKLLFSEVNPIPVKAAMEILGFNCGPCRLPLGTLSRDTFAQLQNQLSMLGI